MMSYLMKIMFMLFVFSLFPNMAFSENTIQDINQQEIIFENDGISLAGVFLTPNKKGPFPSVVLVQGSGASGRNNVWAMSIAKRLVMEGLGVLVTDKRGVGKSLGDWRKSSIEDRAKDTLAAVESIRVLPNVKKDNIGLIGLSQGGVVVPLAASMGNVQFVLNFVGGSVSMKELVYHGIRGSYLQHNLNEEQIDFLQKLTTLSYVYIETGKGWQEYLDYRIKVKEIFGELAVEGWPVSKKSWYWEFYGNVSSFDPTPYWKKITENMSIPSFIALGELDEFDNVPVEESVKRLKENVSSKFLTVQVYENTGHSLMDEEKRKNGEWVLVGPLNKDLSVWIKKNVLK